MMCLAWIDQRVNPGASPVMARTRRATRRGIIILRRRSNLTCLHVCTTSPRQRRFWQIMVTSVPMAWVGSPPNDEGDS